MKKIKKTLVLVLAFMLIAALSITGTWAYLTATTDSVVNTFTVGKVAIDLTEENPEGQTAKMIPGTEIVKDPKATVKADSEDCWLFVKITESENFGSYMTYSVADGWTKLSDGVYYRQVSASTADQSFDILKDNKVSVLSSVGNSDANPTLAFQAYAIQQTGFSTASAAWTEVSK